MSITRNTVVSSVAAVFAVATAVYSAALFQSRSAVKKERNFAQLELMAARVEATTLKEQLQRVKVLRAEVAKALKAARGELTAATNNYLAARRELDAIKFNYLTAEEASVDVRSKTRSDTVGDLVHLRSGLIRRIFGSDALDTNSMPISEEPAPLDGYTGVASTKRLLIRSAGLMFRPQFFEAVKGARCLALYHEGHDGIGIDEVVRDGHHRFGRHVIQFFLDRGCDVLAFSMPLLGENDQLQGADLPGSHAELLKRNPSLRPFVEQVVVALNAALTARSYDYTVMIGLSGGGWSTTLAAAVDPRITYSFSIAGSYPMYLRRLWDRDMGDAEQTHPDLVKFASYFDLYLLSAFGKGRHAALVYNRNDPCCFAGVKQYSFKAQLLAFAKELGIDGLSMLEDTTNTDHVISPWMLSELSRMLPRPSATN